MPLMLDFDSTAELPANFIQNESHVIGGSTTRYWVPAGGCFFTKGLILRRASDNYLLQPGIDYKALHFIASAAEETGKEVCAIILVHNPAITGEILQDYHAVGGTYSATVEALEELLANLAAVSGNEVAWGQLVGVPAQLPPTPHGHHLADWYGLGGLITKLEEIRQSNLQGDIATIQMIYQYINNAIAATVAAASGTDETTVNQLIANAIAAHKAANGEHSKASIGLSNVPNWAALSDTDANVAGVAGKNTHMMNAAQILSLIQDRVTKLWLGLDQLPNYGVASDTDVDTGTAVNKLMTPAATARSVLNIARIGTTAASAANILTPLFTANFNDANPPTDATSGGVTGVGVQFFGVAKGATVSVTTPRTQFVIIASGTNAKGIWTRSHNGTSWTAWAAAGTPASVGLNGIVNHAEATESEALAGTASDKRITPRRARDAALGVLRHVGLTNTQDPNTTLQPSILASGQNCPTGLEGSLRGDNFAIQTIFNPGANTDVNSVGMARTQIAYGRSVSGVWSRTYNGTNWTWWRDITTDETERAWANANAYVFDYKHYDKKSWCTAVDTFQGLTLKAIIGNDDSTQHLQWTTHDFISKYDNFNLGYADGAGTGDAVIGSTNIGGSFCPITKIVQIDSEHISSGNAYFYIRKLHSKTLATAVVAKVTSQLVHFRAVDGQQTKLLEVTAGSGRISLIDIFRLSFGFIALVFRQQSNGTIGVMFSRHGEAHPFATGATSPNEWSFGVPLTDNTASGLKTLLATQGEGTVTNRGTWYGLGAGHFTMSTLDNALKFRETTFGKFIKADITDLHLHLIFAGGVVTIRLDTANYSELTGLTIATAGLRQGTTGNLPFNGHYSNVGLRFDAFAYNHVNNGFRIISVSETGTDGYDTLYTKTASGSGFTLSESSRPFILKTDDIDLPADRKKILAIGYNAGLIWVHLGKYSTISDVEAGVNEISALACAPWDPIKSRSNILKLHVVYGDPLVWNPTYPTMYTTPIVINDGSGRRLHYMGSGKYPFNVVVAGRNNYQSIDYTAERHL